MAKEAGTGSDWSLSILMDSRQTARVPFIPVRWKSETRLRTAALYDVKVSTLELFGRQLWFDYKEIVVPTGGNGRDRLNPLPFTNGICAWPIVHICNSFLSGIFVAALQRRLYLHAVLLSILSRGH